LLLALFLLLLSYDIFRDTNDKVIFYSFLFTFMSFYIILWNYTDQGIKNVKESPKRVNIFKSKLENAGGKLIETYYTFGKYDGVSIVEAPNDEALMSCLLSIGSQGNARTVTLKAFTYEDASKIMENIQQ
jgi:uncharacterized protein with GYD domain